MFVCVCFIKNKQGAKNYQLLLWEPLIQASIFCFFTLRDLSTSVCFRASGMVSGGYLKLADFVIVWLPFLRVIFLDWDTVSLPVASPQWFFWVDGINQVSLCFLTKYCRLFVPFLTFWILDNSLFCMLHFFFFWCFLRWAPTFNWVL